MDAALASEPDKGRHKTVSEWAVRLTAAESEELAAELEAVVERWRSATQGAEGDRLTYSVYQLIQPLPGPDSDPDPDTD